MRREKKLRLRIQVNARTERKFICDKVVSHLFSNLVFRFSEIFPNRSKNSKDICFLRIVLGPLWSGRKMFADEKYDHIWKWTTNLHLWCGMESMLLCIAENVTRNANLSSLELGIVYTIKCEFGPVCVVETDGQTQKRRRKFTRPKCFYVYFCKY